MTWDHCEPRTNGPRTERDHRAQLVRALTAQAFGVAMAALWSYWDDETMTGEDFSSDFEIDAHQVLEDIAALPAPADLAATLLGDA